PSFMHSTCRTCHTHHFIIHRRPLRSTLFPYTTLFRSLIEAYRKLRNTFRYTLGNLYDFNPEKDVVPVAEMLEIDRWILARTEDRSEEHTSELQSHLNLVCRLLLEKKKPHSRR